MHCHELVITFQSHVPNWTTTGAFHGGCKAIHFGDASPDRNRCEEGERCSGGSPFIDRHLDTLTTAMTFAIERVTPNVFNEVVQSLALPDQLPHLVDVKLKLEEENAGRDEFLLQLFNVPDWLH